MDEDDVDGDNGDYDDDLTLMTPQSPGSVLCGERNNSFWWPGAATTWDDHDDGHEDDHDDDHDDNHDGGQQGVKEE